MWKVVICGVGVFVCGMAMATYVLVRQRLLGEPPRSDYDGVTELDITRADAELVVNARRIAKREARERRWAWLPWRRRRSTLTNALRDAHAKIRVLEEQVTRHAARAAQYAWYAKTGVPPTDEEILEIEVPDVHRMFNQYRGPKV